MSGTPAREVVLYGRPGCHLCEEARATLERVRAELPFELVERDIERDAALHRAYLERIPVIALDGEELFDYFVDEPELRRRLAGLSSRPAGGRDAPDRRDHRLQWGAHELHDRA